jgi:hypothetical protein
MPTRCGRPASEVTEVNIDYHAEPDLEHIAGGAYPAMSPRQLPAPGRRPALAARIARALPPSQPSVELVRVAAMTGTIR